METLKIVLIFLLIAICVALTIIILFQEGKQNGLGSLSGQQFDIGGVGLYTQSSVRRLPAAGGY